MATCVFACLCAPLPAQAAPGQPVSPLHIAYSLAITDLDNRLLRVTLTVDHPPPGPLDFAIPAWSPGYYQILHYEQNIHDVAASDSAGRPIPLTHPSPRVWEIADLSEPPSPLVLTYTVSAEDEGLGFFGSVLDATHGYVNGASAFLYLTGHTDAPVTLTVTLPPRWKLATPLTPAHEKQSHVARRNEFLRYRALRAVCPSDTIRLASLASEGRTAEGSTAKEFIPSNHSFHATDYAELIDGPLQFGQFDEAAFQVAGVPFQCVLVGRHHADTARLIKTLRESVRAAERLFGALPFPRYVFFYHCGGGGFYGGLEHRNSTVIHLPGAIGDAAGDNFITISTHELFHAWNVKRIRPEGLGPFDLTQPVRIASLWWAEGVTDYYAELLPVRAGLRDREWFLHEFAGRIAELETVTSRKRISLEEASRRAWEGGSEGFDGLSYYTKGSLVALYFDLRLRALTANRKGLDDVMRLLDTRFGKTDQAYPEAALLAALDEVAEADLGAEYARFVRGTEEIAWNEVLPVAGITLHRDKAPFLGILLDTHPASADANTPNNTSADPTLIAGKVEPGFAGEKLGLHDGDHIVSVNHRPVTPDSFSTVFGALPPNSPLTLEIQRDGVSQTLSGDTGQRYIHPSLTLLPEKRLVPLARRIRDSLFSLLPAPTVRPKTSALPSASHRLAALPQ